MAAVLPSEGYDSEAVKAQARAWVDGVNSASGVSGGWRLQVLRLRTRRKFDGGSPGEITDVNGDTVSSVGAHAPDGKCDELPARLRRFVPGCPWALVDQAIRYLYEIAPYTGIVYNGVKLESKYRPTLTQWVRDDQTTVGERGANGTYTLIQDLIEVTDCDDSLEVATGASCSAYEETTFKWDADSVEPLPVKCEQGVTWSIRAVSRSEEDGTYSYQLVKTVARTRHYGPVLVECGPQAEVTEESWESAYGEPGAFEARGCDVSGPIETPPCDTAPGVRTQVQYRENPDCTFDVVVRRRTSKKFSDSWRDGTACRPQDVTVVRNAKAAPPVPVPAVGERVDRRLQRIEVYSYDVSVTVVRAPDPYSYSWTDGSACHQRSVEVLRAQKAMPRVPAVRSGETLEADVQRNEDCTWDARFAVTKSPSAFVHSWTEGSACRPVQIKVAQNSPRVPVPPVPGPGESVSMTLSRNPDCTYDSRIQVVKPALETSFSWTQGSSCRPENVTAWHRVATRPEITTPKAGEVVRASISLNEDCTYDGQMTVVSPPPESILNWTDGSPCRWADHKVWQGLITAPEPAAREAGKMVSASIRRNDDCTYDGTQEVVTNKASQITWTAGSACEQVETQAFFHSRSMPRIPGGEIGSYVRASIQRNEDCTFSGTIDKTRASSRLVEWTDGAGCAITKHTAGFSVTSVSVPSPSPGTTVSASVSMNRDCTYNYQSAVRKSQPFMHTQDWESEEEGPGYKYTYDNSLVLFANQSRLPPVPHHANVGVSSSVNEDCTYNGTYTTRNLKKWSRPTGGGGSGGTGTGTITKTFKAIVNGVTKTRKATYAVTVYEGEGNASASTLAHHQEVSAAGGRIFCLDVLNEGVWQ